MEYIEEKTVTKECAFAAKRRISIAMSVVTTVMIVVLLIITVVFFPVTETGDRRTATVSASGMVRVGGYHFTVEELGLEECGLSEGDKVLLFFESDGRMRAAYPKEQYESRTEGRLLLIVTAAVVAVTVICLSAVVCRRSFGRPWYDYKRQLKGLRLKERKSSADVVGNILCVCVAVLVMSPEIALLWENARELYKAEQASRSIREIQLAADKIQITIDKLDGLESEIFAEGGKVQSALDSASDATANIHEIMDKLNGSETAETEEMQEE